LREERSSQTGAGSAGHRGTRRDRMTGILRRLALCSGLVAASACSDRPLPFPLPPDMLQSPDMALNLDPVTRACTTFASCELSEAIGTSVNACLTGPHALAGDLFGPQAQQQLLTCIDAAGADCAAAARCYDQANTHQPCPTRPTCFGTAALGCLIGSHV